MTWTIKGLYYTPHTKQEGNRMFKAGDKVRFKDSTTWYNTAETEYTVKRVWKDGFQEDAEYNVDIEESFGWFPINQLELVPSKTWTNGQELELQDAIQKVNLLTIEKENALAMVEQHRTADFFKDLQEVLEKHKVAVFARNCRESEEEPLSEYSKVLFQFYKNPIDSEFYKVDTGRTHSTSGEFNWLVKRR